MAFASAINGKTKLGDVWMHNGTFSGASVNTGDLDTGLRVCHNIQLTPIVNGSTSTPLNANETFPCAGNAVTLNFKTSAVGYWVAFGVQ
jgi:hypothetical protein